ncbi:B3 domain-containing protein REM6-like isoform X1 [Prosopis cineraria]|uniref:B3 domain-containing protein REM6-like isoform X1 n=1 Tax=Prosopis cineraria TaxID=364024 RepID=UPI00240F8DF5|nr:B3 domain-containing protein REM6-like isoform X1 [Prosopis cineraria]
MLKKEDNRIYSANFKISSINAPDMGVLYSPNFMFSFLNAKFLNTDNSNLLMQQIPTLVVSRYCPILPKRATLVRTSSKNRSWEVDIEEEDDKRFYLKNGWNTFVEDNDLETAEFLVFKFDGDCSRYEGTIVEAFSEGPNLDCNENPSFKIILQQAYAKKGVMCFPTDFFKKHMKNKRQEVEIEIVEGVWTVTLIPHKKRARTFARFSEGWSNFAKANHFKTGETHFLNDSER